MTPAEVRAKVTRSRARQGLPPTVEDPAALERAAAALRLATPSEPVVSSPRKRRRETAEVTVVVT
ncbi:MAG: hypothetical protein JO063_10065 [Pseudonocardiales bacterium]|nr:hypothetical protein [Pseudonocardiales bacterium]MBV9031095.1 hypothetical protein [Pseudonocardiales bacterium]MBW0010443.1 hypothetical protein [Pseudonocardiales bacterium]